MFTARIARWWPLAELSVYGAGTTVTFDGGQIVERAPDGAMALWGTVTRWEPPGVLAFSWHPGNPPERASHVEITFAAAAGQTLVTVRAGRRRRAGIARPVWGAWATSPFYRGPCATSPKRHRAGGRCCTAGSSTACPAASTARPISARLASLVR